MWLTDLFKPRVNLRGNNFRFVPATVLVPGAESFAAEDTLGNPMFVLGSYPQYAFNTLPVYQAGGNKSENLSLVPHPPQGFVYGGMQQAPLLDADNLPDVAGTYYD